jgi:hypothetical protein
MAARQGILYAHQIGVTVNGSRSPTPVRRSLLANLLAGPVRDLEPVRARPSEPLDPELDPAQREAVDRALSTPDLCLIQGGPGTGKSRLIGEIVARAVERGERVLLLASNSAALDRVLEQLGTREGLYPVRWHGPAEDPALLAPCVRRFTFAERLRSFREGTLALARQSAAAARHRVQNLQADAGFSSRLEEAVRRHEELTRQLRTLAERCQAVPEEVQELANHLLSGIPAAPSSSFQAEVAACAASWEEARTRLDVRLAAVRADADKVRSELDSLATELERLRPLAEAKQTGRWWTGAWWQATFHPSDLVRFKDQVARQRELEAEWDRLAREVEELTRERAEAEAQRSNTSARLVAAETARRLAGLNEQIAALNQEHHLLLDNWKALCQELEGGVCPGPGEEAVQCLLAARADKLRKAEQELVFAEDWAHYLEETLQTAPGRLGSCFNVVAATTLSLPLGPEVLGDARPIPFDLLILDEADQVTESEFLNAARGARRWVLVGEPAPEEGAGRGGDRKTKSQAVRSAFLDPRSAMFQRLWSHLHPDLRSLPYRWGCPDGRLHCLLQSVPADLERWVETESVLDRPEIELRIVAPPGKPSQLVEVIFPAGMGLEQAKQFVYLELQEAAIQVGSPYFRWIEQPDGVELLLDPAPLRTTSLLLEPGLTERVAVSEGRQGPGFTAALHFSREAGWDRAKAELWLEKNLRTRDVGRTAFLAVPHRTSPALARVLGELLPHDFPRPVTRVDGESNCSWGGAVFELLAVPPLTEDPESGRQGGPEVRHRKGGTATATPRLRHARGGAGLEVDLANSGPLEQVPADLRAALPSEGLVNFFEARAVVRYLERLLTDPRFRAAAEAWRRKATCQRTSANCEEGAEGTTAGFRPVHSPAIAVMAPYSAQVELIRLLIAQNPTLAAPNVGIEIGRPADFRQRECLTALISLTRSHTHRAVTYGEGPEALILALTRAAERLVVFADLGTLARRAAWQGAVDHLGEAAATRERDLAARLLRFLHNPGCESGVA